MSHPVEKEFGTIRSFLWPIYRHERRMVVPMLMMLFLIGINYSILRCMKDSVVVTASVARAGLIPFIKVWVLLPTALLSIYLFTKLSNRFSQERVFYVIISSFLIFYALFAFVLYPLRDFIHPHSIADRLELIFPSWLHGFVEMFRYWSFTGFYVMAELWSSVVVTVLFWGFANEVTKVSKAKRFYAVLIFGANMASIFAGFIQLFLGTTNFFNPSLPHGHVPWDETLRLLIGVIIVSGLSVMVIFWWMNRKVLKDPSFESLHQSQWKIKTKKKLSLRESFAYLLKSKYLLSIAVLVLAYNLVMNLVELIWKDQVGLLYPNPSDYNNFMSLLLIAIGTISMGMAFFMPKILDRYGWTVTALITPVILLVTCVGFFSFLLFQKPLSGAIQVAFGTTPVFIAVLLGGVQNCLSKVAKFTVFDATKEMAFIPLEHDVKLKGKAAIDGFGSRLGKSGGSVIHGGFYAVLGGLSFSAPYVAGILLVVISVWICSVRSLGKQFNVLVNKQRKKEGKPPQQPDEQSKISSVNREQPASA